MSDLREFYEGLAQLLGAGVPLREALDALRRNGTLREPLASRLVGAVEEGRSLTDALAGDEALPPEEAALIQAGEATGRLDENLERLARLRRERAEVRQSLLTQATYPILLFHAAAVMLPVANLGLARELTLGNWLERVLAILVPAYAIVALFVLAKRTPGGRRVRRRIVEALPGFGAASRHRRRADFALVLAAAYESGVPLDRGVALAARTAGSEDPEAGARVVAGGRSLSEGLAAAAVLDPRAIARVATAEGAGEVTAALDAVASEESTLARETWRRSVILLGKLLYLAVAAWIALSVISFYADYVGTFL